MTDDRVNNPDPAAADAERAAGGAVRDDRRDGLNLGSEPHTYGIDEPSHPQGQPPKNLLDGMYKALRPKQWVKNVLVLSLIHI